MRKKLTLLLALSFIVSTWPSMAMATNYTEELPFAITFVETFTPAQMETSDEYIDVMSLSEGFLVFERQPIRRAVYSFTTVNGHSFRIWARNDGNAPLTVSVQHDLAPNTWRAATMTLQPRTQGQREGSYAWSGFRPPDVFVQDRIYIVFESTAPISGEFTFRQFQGQAMFP